MNNLMGAICGLNKKEMTKIFKLASFRAWIVKNEMWVDATLIAVNHVRVTVMPRIPILFWILFILSTVRFYDVWITLCIYLDKRPFE